MPQDLFTSSSTQGTDLGAFGTTGDGRGFRYFLQGSVAAIVGQVAQGPDQDTTNQNPSGGLAVAAAAIGATTVTLTGTLTLAANLLSGAYMSVAASTGAGYTYKVKGNTVVASAANCVVTLEDPILVALTTSSKVVFMKNLYNGLQIAKTTLTNAVAGVSVYPVAAAQYGWVQTHGQVGCLQTGTGTCGTALGVLQGGTQGSLAPAIAGTPIVAFANGTNVTTEYDLVFMVLD